MTKVYIENFEPIGLQPSYRQYWSDVWLSYTIKPGRTKKRLAPTLTSISFLKRDLEIDEETQKSHPEIDYSEEIAFARETIKELASKPFVIRKNCAGTYPEIFTAAEYLDQRGIESMLFFYFSQIGLVRVRFKWRRTKPSQVIIPVMV